MIGILFVEAKDGGFGFDFESNYKVVNEKSELTYIRIDGRRATIIFQQKGTETKVTTTFDSENENLVELQKASYFE